jgi:hypothetical protein
MTIHNILIAIDNPDEFTTAKQQHFVAILHFYCGKLLACISYAASNLIINWYGK